MRLKAQSLIEFSIILMLVTLVAIISLNIISARINKPTEENTKFEEATSTTSAESSEEVNCTKMGLHWDRQNSVCEAR